MGLTYSELAAREGVPVATLKSRIRRAVLAVRKNFDDE
jgi:DNA-directed RNA polymerase specialized sigma24 family protein